MMNKSHVLMLDDDAELRMLVRELLLGKPRGSAIPATHDMRFYESPDPVDAYHKFARQRFDLLILDIGLPKHDGYEVLERLLELPDHMRPRRVLVLSGHADEVEVHKRWPGPIVVLLKPCRGSELCRHVAEILNELGGEAAPKQVA